MVCTRGQTERDFHAEEQVEQFLSQLLGTSDFRDLCRSMLRVDPGFRAIASPISSSEPPMPSLLRRNTIEGITMLDTGTRQKSAGTWPRRLSQTSAHDGVCASRPAPLRMGHQIGLARLAWTLWVPSPLWRMGFGKLRG